MEIRKVFFYSAILFLSLLFVDSKCNEQAIDCYKDRSTTEKISNVEGFITKKIGSFFISVDNDASKSYQPCNLSTEYEEEGMKILFSGKVKEIYPHERRAGSPFVISEIKKRN